jgi:Rieske Fe-S protein
MPGEDQERFEDYLELERFIEQLQAGRDAHPPQELTPTQARVYRMATLFHAATPGVSEPDPEFAAQLQMRLEEELQRGTGNERRPPLPPLAGRKQRVSRRLLLTGSVAAAAGVAIGISVDRVMEQEAVPAGEQTVGQMVVVKIAEPTEWFTVTTTARLGNHAVKFRVELPNGAPLLTGYLLRSDGSNGQVSEKGQFIAVSATCTHKGCIVNWSSADRRFHCPCHGGVFTQDGGIDTGSSALTYLESLPALEVRVVQSEIRVRMPLSD